MNPRAFATAAILLTTPVAAHAQLYDLQRSQEQFQLRQLQDSIDDLNAQMQRQQIERDEVIYEQRQQQLRLQRRGGPPS